MPWISKSYNPTHPKGKNFSELELKPAEIKFITNIPKTNLSNYYKSLKTNHGSHTLPDVGFIIQHMGESNLLIVYFALDVLDEVNLGLVKTPNRIYCGKTDILHPK